MKIHINDRSSYAITKREYLDNGFLRAPGRVARIGIQEYLASELGLKDRNPNDIVRVYRPPEEVFKPESLDTYKSVDVTIEHPSDMVDSESFKKVTAGHVESYGSVDGDFVVCDLIIKDKAAIKAVEQGKIQLSAGYTSLYDDNVPEGADYEFIQRDIRINHVALVDRARAGAQARLFDHKTGGFMPFKIVFDSGRQVEVADEATALKVQNEVDALKKRVSDADDEVEKLQAEKDSLEEQLEESKKKSSDKYFRDQMAEIISVRDQAKKIAGKEFSCDSLDLIEIKRAALSMVRDSVDWPKKKAAYVEAAFDMEMENKESEDEEEMEDEEMEEKKKANDSYRRLAKDSIKAKPSDPTEMRAALHNQFLDSRYKQESK